MEGRCWLYRVGGIPMVRDAGWIVAGSGIPLVVAVVSIPPLIAVLGLEQFAVLGLAWTVLGYFGLLDFGLGRALTRHIVSRDLFEHPEQLRSSTWTTVTGLFLLGVMITLVILPFIPWLTRAFFNIPPALQEESRSAFLILAMGVPVATVGSALVGFLEARRRFPTLGLRRLVTGALNYAAPLAAAVATRSLAAAVAAVVVVRLLMTTALLGASVISTPALRRRPIFDYRTLAPMLGYGAWLTLSNFIAPAILYADRFIIGAFLPVVWLAYYATPQDIVTRLWIVPGAFASVLFPKFVAGEDGVSSAAHLLGTGLAWVSLAIFPPVLLLCAFSTQLLALWTGDDFAQKSGLVLAWFSVGVLINSGAQVVATFVQARGRADLTAKLYIVEFPLYCGLLLWLVPQFGIAGAAYAWVARIGFDALALLAFSVWLMPAMRALVPGIVTAAAIAISVCAVAYATQSVTVKAGIFAVVILGAAAFAWKRGFLAAARDVPWRRIGSR